MLLNRRTFLLTTLIMSGAIVSCTKNQAITSQANTNEIDIDNVNHSMQELTAIEIDQSKIVMGQTVYVPVYSQIYHHNSQNSKMNLSVTLSVRNTDMNYPLIITSVYYYDSYGKLLKKYIENPVELKPLASTEVFIRANDISGGIGANFIVDWVATNIISPPIIEAVMISTALNQGISFLTEGKVIKEYQGKK